MQKNMNNDFQTITKYEEQLPTKRKRFEDEEMETETEKDYFKKVRFDEPVNPIWPEAQKIPLENQRLEYVQKQSMNYQKLKQSEELKQKKLEKELEELKKENEMYTECNNLLKDVHYQRVQRSFSKLLLQIE